MGWRYDFYKSKYMADQASYWSAFPFVYKGPVSRYTTRQANLEESGLNTVSIFDTAPRSGLMNWFFHIQILRTYWVSNDFLRIYGTWIWKFSPSARITEVLTCTLDFESSRLPFLDHLIKRGRTNFTEEDGIISECCVTAEAMFGLWNDSALQ